MQQRINYWREHSTTDPTGFHEGIVVHHDEETGNYIVREIPNGNYYHVDSDDWTGRLLGRP